MMQLCHAGKTLRPLRDCSLHSHDAWELVYNEKGTGTILIGATRYPFTDGSAFLYPPGVLHKKESEGLFEDYYVSFFNLDLAPGVYRLEDGGDGRIFLLVRLLYLCYCDSGPGPVCDNLLAALEEILKTQLSSNVTVDKNAQQLRQLILDRFSDAEFKIQDAMEKIPLNKDYLRRCFKAAYGMTPQDYLMQLRIENAKHLLSQMDKAVFSVADAAYMSGFYDPLYFSRAFKKYTGRSPSEWKGK